MTRKNLQWIAFASAISPTFALAMAMIVGFQLSREDTRTILSIAYGLSVALLLISLLLPKIVTNK